MRFKKIIKLFNSGNVCVVGLRGKGKDLIFGNVINRKNKDYVSNLYYGNDNLFNSLDLKNIDIPNTFENLIDNNIKYWEYPYPLGSDIYLSDAGVYFPSQYNGILNNKYKGLPMYQALSRQVSYNNFHFNTQNLNRVWDKIREQSDVYILCKFCFYIPFFNIVIQKIYIYDKYQSCVDRVKPCRIKVPLFGKENRLNAQMYIDKFKNTYGDIKSRWLIYHNKSKHDTFYFHKLFKKEV